MEELNKYLETHTADDLFTIILNSSVDMSNEELYKKLLEADKNLKKLKKLLLRIYNISIFDPACGSGNFLVITLLSLLSYNFSIAESDLSKVYKEYKIDNKILKITNNGFLDEVWLCSSTNKDCELINRHFSFIRSN